MLDIRHFRENVEELKERLKYKKADNGEIDKIVLLDKKRRELILEADKLKAEQNLVSKQIPILKKENKDVTEIFAKMKDMSARIKEFDQSLSSVNEELNLSLLKIPNIPHESAPIGDNEEDNKEIMKWGEIPSFSFEPKPHWDLGKNLGILDFERAAKVTGSRFTFLRNHGARLERAIINFFLDTHITNGYEELFPPYMVNRASLTGTGQLPKFEEDAFLIEKDDYFLIPTAEVPVTNFFKDEVLDENILPKKFVAYSACFRSEAGSAGRDTRGLIRQHQFNKVEIVKFSHPDDSYKQLESLTKDARKVLELLKLPYRVVEIATGDLGFTATKKYDLEVYMPSYGKYVEISSCSNFEDFQARRINIKFRNSEGKLQFCHTLNGSGVAVGRTMAAILENFQNEDGSINIPEVLVPYMKGMDIIKNL